MLVGEEELAMLFSNFFIAKLVEPGSQTILFTFAQYSTPDFTFITEESIPDEPIQVPARVVGRLAIPIDKYKEWLDSSLASYEAMFGTPSRVSGQDKEE